MADVDKKNLYIIGGVVLGLILLFGVLYYTTDLFKAPGEEGVFEALADGEEPSACGYVTDEAKCTGGVCGPGEKCVVNDSDADNPCKCVDDTSAGATENYITCKSEECRCLSDNMLANLEGDESEYRCNKTAPCGKDFNGDPKYCYNLTKLKEAVFSKSCEMGCSCVNPEDYAKPYAPAPCGVDVPLEDVNGTNVTEFLDYYQICDNTGGEFFYCVSTCGSGGGCGACKEDDFAEDKGYELCGSETSSLCGAKGLLGGAGGLAPTKVIITDTYHCYKESSEDEDEDGGNGKTQCGDGIINASAGENCDPAATKVFGGKTCASYGFDGGNLSCEDCSIKTKNCKNVTLKSCEGDKPAPEDWSDCEEGEQTRKVAECDTSTGEWKMTGTETEECEVEKGLAWWIWLAIGGGVLLLLGGIFAVWYFVFRKPGGAGLSKKTPSPQGGKSNKGKKSKKNI